MSVIITDSGFGIDDFKGEFVALTELPISDPIQGVDIQPSDKVESLSNRLADIPLIRIAFPSFSDGRGFTLARRLRQMGYAGRLRAFGHILADQYTMVRRAGFDEVQISDDLAARQPADQWLRRANWQAHDYQAKLRA
jgi:uncharacterized protein (DUF934 family)